MNVHAHLADLTRRLFMGVKPPDANIYKKSPALCITNLSQKEKQKQMSQMSTRRY